MNNLVFGINEKDQIRNFENKKGLYTSILKESLDDFLKDYEFLNAFKHGFRIQSIFGDNKVSVNGFLIQKGDSAIKYYSKQGNTIYKNNITFNFISVLNKCVFINSIIYNSKIVFLAKNTNKQGKLTLKHFYPKDIKEFNNDYGSFRNKLAIFELVGKSL